MSSDAQPGTGEDATTDRGSSNEIFNEAGGNRVDRDDPGTLHK